MAVAEGERSQSKLEVIVRALDLTTYTIRITNNQKIFLPEYRSSLTDDIIRTAKDIYIDAWTANNILVKSADDWKMRKALQERAARNCNNLLALIQLAKTIFHLKSKRVKYWSEKTIDVRGYLRSWRDADSKRYGK